MNRKSLLVAAVATLASVASFAGEADPAGQYAEPVQSVKSRAEVLNELAAFKQSGVNPWSIRYNPLAVARSTQDREQVRAGYLADRERVSAMGAEDSGSAYLSQQAGRSVPANTLAGSPAANQF
ncbi:DUF4148 domain-containing protein [Ramlibacter rhizophilus]|uniref:DUF4148 domain-containing protein n=1 Tax=Ramlibacter rhizophilus TaxID=1781167 RepID=A0A4Z0BDS2_9BURK|nr:DUF4148 domain-containing protein [Ramlibacter rhizophilus]TFY97456.1 DUF4148 domain-containing protein [Ramlibacter rhizophilus]